jgi:hypothetical protein
MRAWFEQNHLQSTARGADRGHRATGSSSVDNHIEFLGPTSVVAAHSNSNGVRSNFVDKKWNLFLKDKLQSQLQIARRICLAGDDAE